MIPILYSSITEGTVPSDYGVGALTDCLSCSVTEERNGAYELTLEYASEGIHAAELVPNAVIKAKPNFTDDPQLFRIYKIGKVINGRFTVNAQHISYDLSGKVITSGSAGTCVAACLLLDGSAGNFTVNTDKSVTASFTISAPASVRSYFGGKEGSLLDVFGGEWKYDNFTCSLKQARGSDRGVEIRYGKNLTELSQDLDMSNLATAIIPFYIDDNGAVTTGAEVSTGLSLTPERKVAIDFSTDVDPESGTAITTQLNTLATRYIANNNLTAIKNSITLNFVQSGELSERVDLCDTVHIYFEALGISASVKCVATTWDVLEGRYTQTTFGESRTNIADTIANSEKELADRPSTSAMAQAVSRATQLITGNLGGYVLLHDTDNDGCPDEILIMDTDDIDTATKVWRWNKSGLGYSSTGYSGTYGLAMTSAGQIVADYITTGTLNANLIKAGVISDVNGNSTINMTTGIASMYDFDAKYRFRLLSTGGVEKVAITHNQGTGTNFTMWTEGGVDVGGFSSGANGLRLVMNNASADRVVDLGPKDGVSGGRLILYDASNCNIFEAGSNPSGYLHVRSSSNQTVASLFTGSYADGTLNLFNNAETNTINLSGHTGVVTCVAVNQTSSRKVKENIEPIPDAEKILELEAVRFDYKNKAQGTDKRGFIAEDVAEVLPNLVTPETDTTPATLDYISMIPYLQDVIKSLNERVASLEDKLNNLGG